MKRYKTTDTVQLFSGLIGLDARQAKPRLQVGQVVPAGAGVYEIMKPVQFKVGEVVLLTDPKGLMRSLECLDVDDEPVAPAEVVPPAAPVAGDAPVADAPAPSEAKRSPGRPGVSRGGRR